MISASPVTRPTRAEIDLGALRWNLAVAKRIAGSAKVMAIVKAEAYGHGLIRIAQEFESLGVEYFGVSFLEEGVALREAGIDSPILVMGGLVDEQIARYFDYDLTLTVSSVWKARHVEAAAEAANKNAKVHLKFDTGIGRVGQNWKTADLLLTEAAKLKRVSLEGIYTHFASSESTDLTFTKLQLERFHHILELANRIGLEWKYRHCANSGAMLQMPDETSFDLVRPGILLFGFTPDEKLAEKSGIKPVMSLRTRVVFVKRPAAETPIGYGSTWRSPGNRWIATLPIGYGDGFPRRAGNKAAVLLNEKIRPIVGNVSMDQITIDAGESAYLGDEAILFGRSNTVDFSLWNLCRAVDAIPYEILCGLTARVPRMYLNSSTSFAS